MEASKVLKIEIVLELLALVFFVSVSAYALFSLNGKEEGAIASYDDVVTILDDKKFEGIDIASDGKALSNDGITYTSA